MKNQLSDYLPIPDIEYFDKKSAAKPFYQKTDGNRKLLYFNNQKELPVEYLQKD